MTRRGALAAGAAALLPIGRSAAETAPPMLVELFTSQGCSSCPPADAFAAELVRRKDVLALTYHVNYWDYLGWKDTLGSAENSQRQYDYAKARGDMDVYTPQMIVNGGPHFSGADRNSVLAVLDHGAAAMPGPGLTVTASETELMIDIGGGASDGEATLWLLPLTARCTVKILKGEIAGKEIEYHNVVRQILPAAMWSGAAQYLRMPREAVIAKDCTGCVALLQRGKAGPVLACTSWGTLAA